MAIIKKTEHKNKCCTALALASASEPEPPGKAITQNVHVTLGYGCWGGFCFCFPRVSCLVIFLLVFSSSTGVWFHSIRFGMYGCFLRRIFMGSRTNCPRQKLEANVSAVDDHCRRHHIEVRVHIWKNVKKNRNGIEVKWIWSTSLGCQGRKKPISNVCIFNYSKWWPTDDDNWKKD